MAQENAASSLAARTSAGRPTPSGIIVWRAICPCIIPAERMEHPLQASAGPAAAAALTARRLLLLRFIAACCCHRSRCALLLGEDESRRSFSAASTCAAPRGARAGRSSGHAASAMLLFPFLSHTEVASATDARGLLLALRAAGREAALQQVLARARFWSKVCAIFDASKAPAACPICGRALAGGGASCRRDDLVRLDHRRRRLRPWRTSCCCGGGEGGRAGARTGADASANAHAGVSGARRRCGGSRPVANARRAPRRMKRAGYVCGGDHRERGRRPPGCVRRASEGRGPAPRAQGRGDARRGGGARRQRPLPSRRCQRRRRACPAAARRSAAAGDARWRSSGGRPGPWRALCAARALAASSVGGVGLVGGIGLVLRLRGGEARGRSAAIVARGVGVEPADGDAGGGDDGGVVGRDPLPRGAARAARRANPVLPSRRRFRPASAFKRTPIPAAVESRRRLGRQRQRVVKSLTAVLTLTFAGEIQQLT